MPTSAQAYPLRAIHSPRQFAEMNRDRSADSSQPSSEGLAMWERIDELATRKKVTTQQLATAAGVTWAAAKRWRQPKERGGAEPSGENLGAIAKVLEVTVEEILQVYDGHEPPFSSWAAFKATDAYARLTVEQRKRIAAHWWADGEEPTLASWLAMAEAHLAARKTA